MYNLRLLQSRAQICTPSVDEALQTRLGRGSMSDVLASGPCLRRLSRRAVGRQADPTADPQSQCRDCEQTERQLARRSVQPIRDACLTALAQ